MKLRVLAATMLMLILAACSGGDAATEAQDSGDAGAAGEPATTAEYADDADDAVDGVESAVQEQRAAVGGGDGAQGGEQDADDTQAPAQEPLPDAPAARTGDRIIKEGTVTIEVEREGFDEAYTKVVAAARQYQGDVVGSTTRTSDNGDTFGSVTVRVPVRSFEDLVVGIGRIGTIRNRDIDSQDVTSEFTDLESRLRHLRAQERFYLGLLDEAKTVADAISVQQQLDGIQSQIEQIQGRLNVLDDRTSFSTLTVELFEPGASTAVASPDDPQARPTLAHYWEIARDAFVNVIGALMVAALFALPLVIIAGALWFGYRALVRPGRPTPAPREEQERERVDAEH